MKRRIIVGLALTGLFLLVVLARVLYSSRAEHLKGRRSMQAGRIDLAIVHYRRSAHWYAPGNPYVTSSLQALWNIADQAEGAGRIELALAAYRAIRSSILGTRSFYTPHADLLAKVNPRIAALMARQQLELQAEDRRGDTSAAPSARPSRSIAAGTKTNAPKSAPALVPTQQPIDPAALERLKKKHLKLLQKTNMPSVGWSLLAILGLAIWVGSAFAFSYRAVTPDDRLNGKKAIFWGAFIIVGLGIWILGLALA